MTVGSRDSKFAAAPFIIAVTRVKATLWDECFKSVPEEGGEKPLLAIAACIERNLIRTHMADKAGDCRWSGYASAVGGNDWTRAGLGRIFESIDRRRFPKG